MRSAPALDDHLESLRATVAPGSLDEVLDDLALVAARLLQVPVAIVDVADDRRPEVDHAFGLVREVPPPPSHPLSTHVARLGQDLVLADAAVEGPPWMAAAGVGACCCSALLASDGSTLGSLCAIAPGPRTWSADDLEALGRLGATWVRELELRQAVRRVEEEASSWAALLAHDMRNPLGAILAASALLVDARSRLDQAGRERMARIVKEHGGRLDGMIGELLEAGRVGAQAPAKPRRPIDVGEVARTVATSVGLSTGEQIEVDVPEGLVAYGDQPSVQRMLDNLVGNAARHAPGQPVTIRSWLEPGAVVLAVDDRGPGIEADEVEAIFERFRQGKRASAAGAGLGLHIVRRLADAHGGTVQVDPREGGGSTFTVRLPQRNRA